MKMRGIVLVVLGSLSIPMAVMAQDITVEGTVKVGSSPRGIAMTPDGSKSYVPDIGTGSIYVVDNLTRSVKSILAVGGGRGARNPAISPDGRYAVVLAPPDAVVIIDTATDLIAGKIFVPMPPSNVTFSTDGSTMLMYILTATSYNYLSKIDMATFTIVAQIPMPKTILTNGFVLTPDNRYALSTSAWSSDPVNSLTVVDVQTMQMVAQVPVGRTPVSIALSSDGMKAFVANYASSSVSVVDLSLRAVVAELVLPGHPYRVRSSVGGASVWAVCDTNDGLASIDAGTLLFTAMVAIPGITVPKNDILFRNDKRLAVATATEGGTLNLVDVASPALIKSIATGGMTTDIVLSSDGSRACAVDEMNGTVVLAKITGFAENLSDAIVGVLDALRASLASAALNRRQRWLLQDAIEKLEGNRGGRAGSGALDKLEKGDLEAALVKVAQAIGMLMWSSFAGVDTVDMQKRLAEASSVSTEQYIAAKERELGATDAVIAARELLAQGKEALTGGEYFRAVWLFRTAVGAFTE